MSSTDTIQLYSASTMSCFAKYVKSKYIAPYNVTCNVKNCYTCDNF